MPTRGAGEQFPARAKPGEPRHLRVNVGGVVVTDRAGVNEFVDARDYWEAKLFAVVAKCIIEIA